MGSVSHRFFASLLMTTTLCVCGCGSSVVEREVEPLSVSYAEATEKWSESRQVEPSEPWSFEPFSSPELTDLPYSVIIHPERVISGSFSSGNASRGDLFESRSVAMESDTMFILPSHVRRDANHGTDELAELLETTAAIMAERFPGTRLALGDLSGATGGDLAHHASHNSGRDVDIPLFVLNELGERIETTAFVRFNAAGQNRNGLQFDVERNWYFARTLLIESDFEVQWLFISRDLRELMLAHAIDIGEPEWLLGPASDALWQPGDSAPHHDHFHVRLYCSEQDRLEGCVNYGPEWPWGRHHAQRNEARVAELVLGLEDEDPQVRIDAIEFLIRIRGYQAGTALARHLENQPSDVQMTILRALRVFQPEGMGREVVGLAMTTEDEDLCRSALLTAGTWAMPEASDMLIAMIADETTTPEMAQLASLAMLDIQAPQSVAHLIDLLEHADGVTRAHLALVLERTAGRSDGINWQTAPIEERTEALTQWRLWYEENGDLPQWDWLRHAFQQAGYTLPKQLQSIDALTIILSAIHEPDPIGYIALRSLVHLTSDPGPSPRWSEDRQNRYWQIIIERVGE